MPTPPRPLNYATPRADPLPPPATSPGRSAVSVVWFIGILLIACYAFAQLTSTFDTLGTILSYAQAGDFSITQLAPLTGSLIFAYATGAVGALLLFHWPPRRLPLLVLLPGIAGAWQMLLLASQHEWSLSAVAAIAIQCATVLGGAMSGRWLGVWTANWLLPPDRAADLRLLWQHRA